MPVAAGRAAVSPAVEARDRRDGDLTDLAIAALDRGALSEAEALARRSVGPCPGSRRAHAVLAMALTESGRPGEGEVHYRLALQARRDPVMTANLAWCVAAQGRSGEARSLYAEAVSDGEAPFETWLGWGTVEMEAGCHDAAETLLARAAAIRPDDAALGLARARLLMLRGRPAAAEAALDALAGPAASEPGVLLGRGRLLDSLGRGEEAFALFTAGKARAAAALGHAYDARAVAAAAARLARAVQLRATARFAAAPTTEGPQPVFILGFPRSGTTLLEQALSRHPAIRAGGELPFLGEVAGACPTLLDDPRPYPEAMAALAGTAGPRGAARLRDAYLDRADAAGLRRPGCRWFTDKMPLNEIHLGLIASAFPGAPLIHLVRHPLDVVLSVFANHLTHGAFCGYDVDTIAHHYRMAVELVEASRRRLDLRFLRIRYEDLVTDLEGTLIAVLDHVGEPYDAACAEPHRNPRVPATPSAEATRRLVHAEAIGRHRAYRHHLAGAIRTLEPVMASLGYAID